MEILIAIILFIVAALLLLVIVIGVFYTIDLFLDLPYVGAKHSQIETIIKLAQIKKSETIIDLGSGDGRLLLAAAKAGAYAIGYELNPFSVLLTRIKLLSFHLRGGNLATTGEHLGGVIVKRQNMWQADLKVADVIFVYSLKVKIKKFEDFIYKNARPGTRVIVNTNPFPNKQPTKSASGIFLYRI